VHKFEASQVELYLPIGLLHLQRKVLSRSHARANPSRHSGKLMEDLAVAIQLRLQRLSRGQVERYGGCTLIIICTD